MLSNLKQGQAIFLVTIFLVMITMVVIGGFVGPVVREAAAARMLLNNKKNYYLAEAGVEDVTYRIKNLMTVGNSESLTVDGATVVTTVTDSLGDKLITSTGSLASGQRKLRVRLTITGGASFNFGVQSDQGGFDLTNNAEIHGNVYANGPITGTSGNWIRGETVSAGPSGLVSGFHATGSVYANNIQNMTIDRNAYYQTLTNSTVAGTKYPNTAPQATSSLPITDEKVAELEALAAAGGTTNCTGTVTITNGMTIGPRKYTCNLTLSGNQNDTIYIAGPIWAEGDIDITGSLNIVVADSVSDTTSIPVIADKASNQLTSSRITLQNNGNFAGSSSGTYVLFLSQNRSAEAGGSESAIILKNNAVGDILIYAGHGQIQVQNNGDLRQITAYRIKLINNAIITYETGLTSVLFTGGPGGAWQISGWSEVE
jgi:hypothetical protein